MKSPFLFVVLAAFTCGRLEAQSVPALINYQGQLTDASGNPLLTADHVLTFTIHDARQGGTQVWGPQVFDGTGGPGRGSKVPVVQGWFNVMLGPVDTSGRSLAAGFAATNRFVEITVASGVPTAPRQQILSAPFALVAEQAGTARVVAGGALTTTGDGKVGVGTPSPNAKLSVRANGFSSLIGIGGTESDNIGYFSFHSNFSPDQRLIVGGKEGIEFRTGPHESSSERMRITAAGNVGIGLFQWTVPEPTGMLHVLGNNPIVRIQQYPWISGDAMLRLNAAATNAKTRLMLQGT